MIDVDRILFICPETKYFIYLLTAEELESESKGMYVNFGTNDYKANVKNNKSIFFSIKDNNKETHAIVEIDVANKEVVQFLKKENSIVKLPLCKRIILDFLISSTNHSSSISEFYFCVSSK